MRLLSVEDDQGVQQVIQDSLRPEFEVISASSLREARRLMLTQSFDIMLLDVQLPDGSGLDFCMALRQEKKYASLPIVILSGRSRVEDRIYGLEVGALDYIAKPFEPAELLARVQVSCMRGNTFAQFSPANFIVQVGRLFIDHSLQRVSVKDNGRELDLLLTPVEFKLLNALLRAKGNALSRSELRETVWGPNIYVADRTIDKNISALRKKLRPYCDAITTEPEKGYLFADHSLVRGLQGPMA